MVGCVWSYGDVIGKVDFELFVGDFDDDGVLCFGWGLCF